VTTSARQFESCAELHLQLCVNTVLLKQTVQLILSNTIRIQYLKKQVLFKFCVSAFTITVPRFENKQPLVNQTTSMDTLM